MKIKNLARSYTIGFCGLAFVLGLSEMFSLLGASSQATALALANVICGIVWKLVPLWLAVVLWMRQRGKTTAQYSDKTLGTAMKLLAFVSYFMAVMTTWSALTYEVPDTGSFQAEAHLWNVFGSMMYTALAQFAQGSMMFAAGKWAAKGQLPPKKYNVWFVILLAATLVYPMMTGMVESFGISQIVRFVMLYVIWRVPTELRKEPVSAENAEEKKISKGWLVLSVILILLALFAGALENSAPSYGSKEYHDKVFDKNPNDWTEDEERYVNDLFEFIDENN